MNSSLRDETDDLFSLQIRKRYINSEQFFKSVHIHPGPYHIPYSHSLLWIQHQPQHTPSVHLSQGMASNHPLQLKTYGQIS